MANMMVRGDDIVRVLSALCPACLGTTLRTDRGGSWCPDCGEGRPISLERVRVRAEILKRQQVSLPNSEPRA